MKIKNAWLTLKHFGYDKKLDLVDELFQDTLVIDQFASVELREKTFEYLKKVFNLYSNNGFLLEKDLHTIFEPLESILALI